MDSRNYDKKRKALINFILAQTTRSSITMAFVISLLSIVVWSSFSLMLVLSWMATGYVLILSRPYIVKIVQQYSPSRSNYFWAENTLAFILFLTGLYWGITSWIFLIPENVTVFVFVALAIVAIAPSALPVFSALPYIWFLYSSPILIITAIKLYEEGLWELAVLAIINLIGLTPLSKNLGKTIEKSITLDMANLELLEEVRVAKDKAEQANLAKSHFLAATSHDLRQPLHAQGILLDALNLRLKKPENIELLNKTIQSNNALNNLFNSLLEISQLDAGTIKTNLGHHSVKELCADIINENQLYAQKKGLSLELEGDDAVVYSDDVLLSRIVRNLINNAIKFTQKGKVQVALAKYDEQLIITISDTGQGIPKSKLKHIFDEYYQINNEARDRSKGIGLGLSLVKRMCELLNHKIEVVSEEGKGSQFALTLPLGNAEKVDKQSFELAPTSIEHLNILIIDDEQSILDAMSIMLKDWNCYPQTFVKLSDAETFITNQGFKPDLIISDYRLEDKLTGLDVISHLQSHWEGSVPAIIISGDTDPVLLAEINQHDYFLLHKPIKARQLKKVIRTLIDK